MGNEPKKLSSKGKRVLILCASIFVALALIVTCVLWFTPENGLHINGVEGETHKSQTYTDSTLNFANGTNRLYAGDVLNYNYSGTYKSVTLPKGTFTITVYGAQGNGGGTGGAGGQGGWAKGNYTITAASAVLYIYVGGQGGYNGGGGGGTGRKSNSGGNGGGATDIRVGGTALGNRIIVAGGGGGGGGGGQGGSSSGTISTNGGAGGASATAGSAATCMGQLDGLPGGAGTASSGGAGGSGVMNNNTSSTDGTYYPAGGGGGGGGYYGGGGSAGGGIDGGSTNKPGSNGGAGSSGQGGAGGAGASSGTAYHSGAGGGGGGGSHYVGGCVSGTTSTSNTGRTGNGYATITVVNVNSDPTAVSPKVSITGATIGTTINRTIYSYNIATDPDATAYSKTANDVDFCNSTSDRGKTTGANVAGLYINSACTTSASGYVSYNFSNSKTLVINNFIKMPRNGVDGMTSDVSMTLYVVIRDEYVTTAASCAYGVFSFTVSFSKYTTNQNSATNATTGGTAYKYHYGAATTNNVNNILTGGIYSDTYTTSNKPFAVSVAQPIIKGTTATFTASTFITNPNTSKFTILFAPDTMPAASGKPYTLSGGGATTFSYWTGSAYASKTGYTSISVTGSSPSPSWQKETWRIYVVETGAAGGAKELNTNQLTYNGTWLSATNGHQFEVWFRVDNTRPVLNTASNLVNLNVGQSTSLSIASYFSDADGAITASTHSITSVAVPTKEFVMLDKYGDLVTTAGKGGAGASVSYYNVAGGTMDANTLNTTATSSVDTGFNTAIASLNSASNEAFLQYSYSGITINVTGLRSSYSQYKSTRAGSAAYTSGKYTSPSTTAGIVANLGHFYLLVHIQDNNDKEDLGIWLPIAFTVGDTSAGVAPVNTGTNPGAVSAQSTVALLPTADGLVNDVYYFTPMAMQIGTNQYPIGQYKNAQGALTTAGLSPLALDADHFTTATGISSWSGKLNEFLTISDAEINNIATSIGANGPKYIQVSPINIYIPQSYFGGRVQVGTGSVAGVKYINPSSLGTETINDVPYYITKGFTIKLLSATMNRYFYAKANVSDSTGKIVAATIAVKCTNTAPVLVDQSKIVTDSTFSAYSVEDGIPTVTYNIPMRNGILITPYDLVRDVNMSIMFGSNIVELSNGFTLNGLGGAVSGTHQNAIFARGGEVAGSGTVTGIYSRTGGGMYSSEGYVGSLTSMLSSIDNSVSAINLVHTSNRYDSYASAAAANVYNDRLFFAREGETSTDAYTYNPAGTLANFAFESRNTTGYIDYLFGNHVNFGTTYNLDFLYIYAKDRNPASTPISIDLTVRDRYGNSDGNTITIRIAVNVVNTPPTPVQAPPLEIAVNHISYAPTADINVLNVASDWDDSRLYYEMKGMLVVNDLQEALALPDIATAESLEDYLNPDFYSENSDQYMSLFCGPDGSLLSESYVSFEMVSIERIVATALNSTQHIRGGVYVLFFVTDLRSSTLCYQQVEVKNSLPTMNTSDIDGFTVDTDYMWSIESTSYADITRERFIVSSTVAENAITEYLPSAVAADVKLIASDSDSLQNGVVLSQMGSGSNYYNLRENEDISTRYDTAVPNVGRENAGLTIAATPPKAIGWFYVKRVDPGAGVDQNAQVEEDPTLTLLFYIDGEWINRDTLIETLKGGDAELKAMCFDDQGRWMIRDWALSIRATYALSPSALGLTFSLRDESLYGGDSAGLLTGYDTVRTRDPIAIAGKVKGNSLPSKTPGEAAHVFDMPTVFLSISNTGIRTKDEYAAYNDYYVVSDPRDGHENTAYVSTYNPDGEPSKQGEDSGKIYSQSLTSNYLRNAFKYPELISVPATKTGDVYDTVYIPMSFFGLQTTLVTPRPVTGEVFYPTETFVGYDIREEQGYNKARIQDIWDAITLSDGSKEWTGEHINDNPYVTIGAIDYGTASNGSGESAKGFNNAVSSKYYNKALVVPNIDHESKPIGFQNFEGNEDSFLKNAEIFSSGTTKIENAFLYLEEQTYKLIEHNFGLTFTKNKMRTGTRNLTLTINLALSNLVDGNMASAKVAQAVLDGDVEMYRSVSVSMKVENSMFDIVAGSDNNGVVYSDGTYHVDMDIHSGETKTYGLVRNGANDPYEAITDSNATLIPYTDTDYVAPDASNDVYRDRVYFRSDSVNTINTWGVDHNRPKTISGNAFAYTAGSESAQSSMRNFYNVSDVSEIADIENTYQPNGGIYGTNSALNVNIRREGYSGYFGISFTQSSRVINIMANKKTDINVDALPAIVNSEFTQYTWNPGGGTYGGLSQAQLKEIYAARGLVVEFFNADDSNTSNISIRRVYYPLVIMLYDDCGAGWNESSYVAIEFRITVSNATPKLKDVGDKDIYGNPILDEDGNPVYSITLDVESSVRVNLYDIVEDKDIYIAPGNRTLLTKADFEGTDGIIRETSDYLESMYSYTSLNTNQMQLLNGAGGLTLSDNTDNDVIMWMELSSGSTRTDVRATDVPLANSLGFTVNRRSTNTDGSNISNFDFTVYFKDNHGASTGRITFRIVVTNKAPTIDTKVRNLTMRAGDTITLLTSYYDTFVGGKDYVHENNHNEDGVSAYRYSMTNGPLYRSSGHETYYDLRDNRDVNYGWSYENLTSAKEYAETSLGEITKPILNTLSSPDRPLNMGYLGVATDDTPWKLRFLPNFTTQGPTETMLWRVTQINRMEIEGLESEKNKYENQYSTSQYPMALRIEALAACENKQFKFTIIDGEGGIVSYEQLYITIVSSTPVARDPADSSDASTLALAHLEGVPDSTNGNYFDATYRLFGIPSGTAYVKVDGMTGPYEGGAVYASNKFTINMTHVAKDPDPGEDAEMRLYREGQIKINNRLVDRNTDPDSSLRGSYVSDYFYVTLGTDLKSITVNITGYNPNSPYETLEFSIEDPGNPDNYLVITLRIYTLYSDLQNPTASAITSETAFNSYLKGESGNVVYVKPYDAYYGLGEYKPAPGDMDAARALYESSKFAVVRLTGNNGNDGNTTSPIVDPDVSVSGITSYGIKVYAFLDREGNSVDCSGFFTRNASTGEFRLTDTDAARDYLLAGISTSGASVTVGAPENLSRLNKYISMSFSTDGTAILFEPKTATIDHDIVLYVEVEKVLGNRTALRSDGILFAGAIFKLVVNDSAPRAVNAVSESSPYQQTFTGYKGDSVTYKIHDPLDPNASLFVDSDVDDKVTVNGFDPDDATDASYRTALAAALEEDDSLDWASSSTKSQRAFTVTINRSEDNSEYDTLTITINRRMDKLEDGKYLDAVSFPLTFTGVDLQGKRCSTVIMITVRNTKMTASTQAVEIKDNNNIGYSFTQANPEMYKLDVNVVYGRDVTINLADFIVDPDYEQGYDYDSYRFVQGTSKSPYQYVLEEPLIAYYYTNIVYDEKIELALIEPIGPDKNHRTGLLISALSTSRNFAGRAYIKIIDRAGDDDVRVSEGVFIEINITVMNEGPHVKEGMSSTTHTVLGSKTDPQTISLNIGDFVDDINDSDVVGEESALHPDTYLRIFSTSYLPYDSLYSTIAAHSGDEKVDEVGTDSSALFTVVIPDGHYNQQFEIQPRAGFYGSGAFNLTIADGDVNVRTDTQYVIFRVNVTVIYNPAEIDALNSISTARGKTKVVSIETLIPDIHNTLSDVITGPNPGTTPEPGGDDDAGEDDNGEDNQGAGDEFGPGNEDEFTPGGEDETIESMNARARNANVSFNPASAYVLLSVEIPRASEEYIELTTQEGSTSTWLLRGRKMTPEPQRVNVTYALKSDVNLENVISGYFMFSVSENEKPRLINEKIKFIRYSDSAEDTMFMLDSQNTIRLRTETLFTDKENDVMLYISATSQKPSLIQVQITENNQLKLTFNARGEADIVINITDETEEVVVRTLRVINTDLPEPSLWMSVVASFEANTVVWVVVLCVVVLLLVVFIIVIAVIRKRKREREELEALLVSEMEIEEEMLRLSGGPSPTGYQSFGYLQSAPAPGADPGLMLGAGTPTQTAPELALPSPDQQAAATTTEQPPEQTTPYDGTSSGNDGLDF
ncbi:MAG: hypothetical protein J1F39_03785 [Clostridiales bacterium]|nr:hypothetical protein [Clostridiales bacterium]